MRVSRDGSLHIIGLGAEGAPSLAPRALALVAAAEVLAGGRRHLELFPDHPAERVVVGGDLDEVAERLRAALGEGRRVVVLASGDPNFYGIAGPLLGRLGRERAEILPNVSAMQLAFARLRLSWEDAALASVHARPLADILEIVRRHPKVGLFTDPRHTPAAVASFLLRQGVPPRRAFVCENLGTPEERVVSCDLAGLPGREFAPLNVLVLVEEDRPSPPGGPGGAAAPAAAPGGGGEARAAAGPTWPLLGLPDGAFAQRRPRDGLITKMEVRAVSLARLALRPGDAVWDVGAGSGSVGIEAARLAPSVRVYAVERRPEDVERVRENAARFGAANLVAVRGEAPEALAALPDPDAVFVGGSGGRLGEILRAAAARLRRGGRLVCNLATLENLAEAERVLGELGWERDLILLNAARSRPLPPAAGDGAAAAVRERPLTRLAALDPVFILAARRPGEGSGHDA